MDRCDDDDDDENSIKVNTNRVYMHFIRLFCFSFLLIETRKEMRNGFCFVLQCFDGAQEKSVSYL